MGAGREETTRVTRDPEQRGRRRCRADRQVALVYQHAGELAGVPPHPPRKRDESPEQKEKSRKRDSGNGEN